MTALAYVLDHPIQSRGKLCRALRFRPVDDFYRELAAKPSFRAQIAEAVESSDASLTIDRLSPVIAEIASLPRAVVDRMSLFDFFKVVALLTASGYFPTQSENADV